MSINLVMDNVEKLKNDTELMLRLLKEHHDGLYVAEPGLGEYPSITLEDDDRQFLVDTLDAFGKIIVEIEQSAKKLGFGGQFDNILHDVSTKFARTYDLVLSIKQGDHYRDGYAWVLLDEFKTSVFALERAIKITKSFGQVPDKIRTYTDREVEAKIRDSEQQKLIVRQRLYLKVDPDAGVLLKQLLSPPDSERLDLAFGKLLHLAGFDYEIYDKQQGDLDVLGVYHQDKIVVLTETTTGNVSKSKIDQILGRKQEYADLLSKISNSNASVYLLVITSKDRSVVDKLAKREAMINKVSIFADKQLEELVNLLKKGKLYPQKLIEIIQKNIPVP